MLWRILAATFYALAASLALSHLGVYSRLFEKENSGYSSLLIMWYPNFVFTTDETCPF